MAFAMKLPPHATGCDDATATLAHGAALPTPAGAIVRVDRRSGPPEIHRLSAGRYQIGSGAGCDITLHEPTVSRAHAEIEVVPDGVVIRDLGSRNGTFYMGQRVEKMTLSLGGRIQFGGASVMIDSAVGELAAGPEYLGDSYRGVIGRSPTMRHLVSMLARLESSRTPVLLDGESGVGKEVVATAIHQGSTVSGGPFITLNCGAMSPELVASELFGHERGSFTGAAKARKGAFECADGGTLFLDEIGELRLDLQPMLLRVLETGEIRLVGGEVARRVKVRVIAATNRDLEKCVVEGSFREDLFYRLAVVRLSIPPLRERPEDIAPLCERFAEDAGLPPLPPDVIAQIKSRPWPGNARQLRNAVHAYGALGVLPEGGRTRGTGLDAALLELVDITRTYADQKDELVNRFTKIYLKALLAHTGGKQKTAAEISGLDRTYISRLLTKLGLVKGGDGEG